MAALTACVLLQSHKSETNLLSSPTEVLYNSAVLTGAILNPDVEKTLMAARDILQLGNPMLFRASAEVEDICSSESSTLARDLSATLAQFRAQTGYGRGIAAPQIGVLKRVIFIRMQPDGLCAALFNPRIVDRSVDTFELWDDCFSFPDLMVRVARASRIRVEYRDDRDSPSSIDAEGSLSELLQHEIDHLDGVLAVQRAVSPQAFATRVEWERSLRAPAR